jgi:hypothetical protein
MQTLRKLPTIAPKMNEARTNMMIAWRLESFSLS